MLLQMWRGCSTWLHLRRQLWERGVRHVYWGRGRVGPEQPDRLGNIFMEFLRQHLWTRSRHQSSRSCFHSCALQEAKTSSLERSWGW